MYMPWWLYKEQLAGQLGFAGISHRVRRGRGMPGAGIFGGLENFTNGSYGRRFKEDARRYRLVHVLRRPGRDDPQRRLLLRDRPRRGGPVGHPGAPVPLEVVGARDQAGRPHAQDLFRNHPVDGWHGGREPVETDGARAIARGGQIIHEVGTCRMGTEAQSSVLNQWCQSWDVKNLFVTDGAPFVSNADKNPRSILALAWRTTDHLVEELKGEPVKSTDGFLTCCPQMTQIAQVWQRKQKERWKLSNLRNL